MSTTLTMIGRSIKPDGLHILRLDNLTLECLIWLWDPFLVPPFTADKKVLRRYVEYIPTELVLHLDDSPTDGLV